MGVAKRVVDGEIGREAPENEGSFLRTIAMTAIRPVVCVAEMHHHTEKSSAIVF